MLSNLIRKLFPSYRSRAQLKKEVEYLRSFCGVTDGPSEMWDISLVIRDLEFERYRLQARVLEVETACAHASRNYNRVLKRWQSINRNFSYRTPHDLCELLLNQVEMFRALPLIKKLERDVQHRWWITTIQGVVIGGDKCLDEALRSAYNHFGLGRKNHGNKILRK